MAPRDEKDDDYRAAWGSIGVALEAGTSWSGHERDRAWRNVGGTRFQDVSAVWGLDSVEDGRIALPVDWDGDGDLDLWMRHRSGPSLRFFENRAEAVSQTVEVAPVHTAVRGIVVERRNAGPGFALDERTTTHPVRPVSDGYLAASRRGLSVALGFESVLSGLRVVQRDGRIHRAALGPGVVDAARVEVVGEPGAWRVQPVRAAGRPLDAEVGALEQGPLPTRVVLRTPLGIPRERAAALGDLAEGHLLIVRSADCSVCEKEVPAYVEGAAGLDTAPHSIVVLEEQTETRTGDFALSVVESILGPGAEIGLPVALLFDRSGSLQVLYTGALGPGEVLQDTHDYVRGGVRASERTAVGRPGRGARWFHAAPRAYGPLIRALRSSGLETDAAVYAREGGRR